MPRVMRIIRTDVGEAVYSVENGERSWLRSADLFTMRKHWRGWFAWFLQKDIKKIVRKEGVVGNVLVAGEQKHDIGPRYGGNQSGIPIRGSDVVGKYELHIDNVVAFGARNDRTGLVGNLIGRRVIIAVGHWFRDTSVMIDGICPGIVIVQCAGVKR